MLFEQSCRTKRNYFAISKAISKMKTSNDIVINICWRRINQKLKIKPDKKILEMRQQKSSLRSTKQIFFYIFWLKCWHWVKCFPCCHGYMARWKNYRFMFDESRFPPPCNNMSPSLTSMHVGKTRKSLFHAICFPSVFKLDSNSYIHNRKN